MPHHLILCSECNSYPNFIKLNKIRYLIACRVMPHHHTIIPTCCKPECSYYKYPVCPMFSKYTARSVHQHVEMSSTSINNLIAKLYHRAKQRHANCCETTCPHKCRKRLISCKLSCCAPKYSKPPCCHYCCCRSRKSSKIQHSRRIQTSIESCTVEILCNKCKLSKSTYQQPSYKTLAHVDSLRNEFEEEESDKPSIKVLKRHVPKQETPKKSITPPSNPCGPAVPYGLPCTCPRSGAEPSVTTRSRSPSKHSRKCSCHEYGVQAFQSKCETDCRECVPVLTSSRDGIVIKAVLYYCRLLSKPRIAVPIILTLFYYIFKTINDSLVVCKL